MTRLLTLAACGAVLAAGLGASRSSWAQDVTVVQTRAAPAAPAQAFAQPQPLPPPPPRPVLETVSVYSGPNRALVGTGLLTFTLAYVPAVIVAGGSSNPADHHLYVPLAGPWINLVTRAPCGPGAVDCGTESTNKVLLAVDGVFQGLGLLTTLVGFFATEQERIVTATATLHIGPAHLGAGGLGAQAYGTF